MVDIEQNDQTQTDPSHLNPESRRRSLMARLVRGPAQGVKPIPLAVALTVGLVTRFAVPRPDGVSVRAWQLLSLFLFTVVGLVAAPLPMGAWSMVCLALTLATKTLSFSEGLAAATSEVLWLIVVSFFFARGFSKTGLGERVAAYAIRLIGRSSLGLSYGLVVAEAVVSPAIPSTTARAGGVFRPVISSLATSVGSKANDKSARKLGAFLIMTQMQVVVQWLKPYLPALIHPAQARFISDREVIDNVVIAHEVLHLMTGRSKAVKWMMIKIDLVKAYDQVHWSFLRAMWQRGGLLDHLIEVIMLCQT